MTPLRQRYTEDLRRRNYAAKTVEVYVRCVAAFAPRGVAVADPAFGVDAVRGPFTPSRGPPAQLRQAPAPVGLLGSQDLLDQPLPVRPGQDAGRPGGRPEPHHAVVQRLAGRPGPEVTRQGR